MDLNKNIEQDQIELIKAEIERSNIKHPHFPDNMFEQLAIMQEEAGEVTKAVLHYKYEGGSIEDVKSELVQTAAMCIKMLEFIKE